MNSNFTNKIPSKWNTRKLRVFKKREQNKSLQMLTCYDFQTAQILNETDLDLILVGDSVGNVILGFDNTISVTIEHMKIFCSAVQRGAPNKFIVGDMPFGTYSTFDEGLKNSINLFSNTGIQAIKFEGAFPHQLDLIKRLTETGIPVMGHIGLTPQSVHQQGGYFTHGKTTESKKRLFEEALHLENAGVFAIVLECVDPEIATMITDKIAIPTIGIGSGARTDGQVLVLNDLLKLGPDNPPKFCKPIANLYQIKLDLIQNYLNKKSQEKDENISIN